MDNTATLTERKVVKHVCQLDCPDTCGIVATIEKGRVVEMRGDKEHPFTRGFLCQKMARYLERVYHRDRLMHPLKRVGAKGEGRFQQISWDEALATIAERYQTVRTSIAGPQAILPYSYCGTMGKLQSSSLDRRFFHRLGASKLDRTICATAGSVGYEYTIGQGRFGADPLGVVNCQLIINWGSNTANTNSHLWSLMLKARSQNNAQIITIDPHRSQTAIRSDWHIPIRPGTDSALALGLMHVIWRDGLQDDDYLQKATLGADLLRDRVLKEYSVERVSQITTLPVEDIEKLARLYATVKPGLIRLNYGLQRCRGGGMAVRTIACLPAIVGGWKDYGGGALLSTSGSFGWNDSALTMPLLSPPRTRTINMNHLGEALAGMIPGPPVRALHVYNSNPAAVAPNLNLVIKGLKRNDLFTVVHDLFLTDTADYADIVLPATSQFEHWDIHGSYGHQFVMLNRPSIDPPGECRSNNDVFRALAGHLGLEPELFPDDPTLIRQALESASPRLAGITLERLEENYSIRLNLPEQWTPFAEGHFGTPSGKCELYCERLQALGIDPLPTYTPPYEDPQTRPDLASRYPLQLVSPPRPQFMNSTFADSDHHLKAAGDPTIELADHDADQRGLLQDDWAVVYNDRGRFLAKVKRLGSVQTGVAASLGTYWNKLSPNRRNVNHLTSSALTDIGGGATFFDNLVEVRRALPSDWESLAT